MRIILLLAMMAMIPLSYADEKVEKFVRDVTPEQREAAEQAVRAILKDPESARFSGLFAVHTSKSESATVCGMVNAKNSYGGYTGDTPFMFSGESAIIADSSGETANNLIVKFVCST